MCNCMKSRMTCSEITESIGGNCNRSWLMDFHKTASFALPNIAAAQIESIASREFVATTDCTTRNYFAFNVELKCLNACHGEITRRYIFTRGLHETYFEISRTLKAGRCWQNLQPIWNVYSNYRKFVADIYWKKNFKIIVVISVKCCLLIIEICQCN